MSIQARFDTHDIFNQFQDEVGEFIAAYDHLFVVEQNRDAQLKTLFIAETPVSKERLRSILVYGGFPLSARHVVDAVKKHTET